MAKVRIGISGWRYAPWRGKFYPEGLRQKDELAYAASKFSTVEINGTSIPCKGRKVLPPGMTRFRRISSSRSRAPATSPTC